MHRIPRNTQRAAAFGAEARTLALDTTACDIFSQTATQSISIKGPQNNDFAANCTLGHWFIVHPWSTSRVQLWCLHTLGSSMFLMFLFSALNSCRFMSSTGVHTLLCSLAWRWLSAQVLTAITSSWSGRKLWQIPRSGS